MAAKDIVEPGTYYVEVTVRQRVTVEEGDPKTEIELVDEVCSDPGVEVTDWDIY
jgi:hypothetical protein